MKSLYLDGTGDPGPHRLNFVAGLLKRPCAPRQFFAVDADSELARTHTDVQQPQLARVDAAVLAFDHAAGAKQARPRATAFTDVDDIAQRRALEYAERVTARAESAAFELRLRQAAAVESARLSGRDEGVDQGWREGCAFGVKWGSACGALAAVVAVMLATAIHGSRWWL